MATQSAQRTRIADATNQRLNLNRFGQGGNLAGRNPGAMPAQPMDAQPGPALPDTSYLEPSALATNSTLMVRKVPSGTYRTTCWFEPLGYCQPGLNLNGWCPFHKRGFFNIQQKKMTIAVKNDADTEIVTYNRNLTCIPMPFEPILVRVMPLIEFYNTVEELEQSLNFGMLHYTLANSHPKRSLEEVDRIVHEHKVYFMLMIEASVSNSDTSSRNIEIPPIVRLNTDECVRYASYYLNQRNYNIHLTIRDDRLRTLYHMDVRKCTAFTQSIVLMFETPYAFNPKMNISLGNHPTLMVADRYLIADQTKMTQGTFQLPDGQSTDGAPVTISVFRFDTGGEMGWYTKQYVPSKQLCLGTNISKDQLHNYSLPAITMPQQ